MVCRLGMSDRLDPVTFGVDQQPVFLGRDFSQKEKNYSEMSATEIDKEVRSIIENQRPSAEDSLGQSGCARKHYAMIAQPQGASRKQTRKNAQRRANREGTQLLDDG